MTTTRSHRAAAEELARRLRAAACLPGPSAVPAVWPCDRTRLDWLRRMTHADLYTWAAEETLARRFIGGDIFQTRQPPAAPDFLAGTDVRGLAPRSVAPFLRRMSLTGPAPRAADLAPAALAADTGRVSRHRRGAVARRWRQPDGGPRLPATTVIPHVVHGIWLGRALPATSGFWANYGAAADHYAGEVDFVLWTDIPRSRCDEARATPPPPPGRSDPLEPVRALLAWAGKHGIHLVNVAEVFHATAPMTLQTPYALEMSQGLPQSFAAASDHLRIEIVYRFGGLYADGDLQLAPETGTAPDTVAPIGYRLFHGRWDRQPASGGPPRLPELFDRVAAAPYGFTVHVLTDETVLNDVILAPAGHPALALWREGARYNYLRDQRDLFGDAARPGAEPPVGERAAWTWAVTPARSGRMHQWLLSRLGIHATDLVKAAPAVRGYSELSWLAPVDGQPPVPRPDADPLPTLIDCVGLLRWRHLSRAGDLALISVAPLVRGLSDPDTAWTALLLAFPDLSADLGPVRSVTDRRRNHDRTLDVAVLPPEAEALLDRAVDPGVWFGAAAGATGEFWFLNERTVAARLRSDPAAAKVRELRATAKAW